MRGSAIATAPLAEIPTSRRIVVLLSHLARRESIAAAMM
jgi:hypothetical protein